MSVARVQFHSEALGRQTQYNVILPYNVNGPFPVLVQLHGLSEDCEAWIERSSMVRHVQSLPLVVVLPDGGTSAYLNWKHAGRLGRQNYEDLIVTDIANHVKQNFNVTDSPWAIGGTSMGGWGAMWLGLNYPDTFASIWSHSAKFNWRDSELDLSMLANPQDVDLNTVAERVAALDQQPLISFDCGVDDQLIEESRALHRHMDRIGLEHHYAEHEGDHAWDYWDLHVQEALLQHARVLGIEPETIQ